MGALELRNGVPKAAFVGIITPDTLNTMTDEMMLEYMGMHLNSDKAAGKTMQINWKQADSKDQYALTVQNSVLLYKKDKPYDKPNCTITMSRATLDEFNLMFPIVTP